MHTTFKSSIGLLLCLTFALSVSAVRIKLSGHQFVDGLSLRKLAQVNDTAGNSTVNGTAGVDSTVLFVDSPRTSITNPTGYENAIGMVVWYNSPTGSFLKCTGALITPTHVLTAAHCVFDSRSPMPASPSRLRFFPGISRAADGSLNSRFGNPQRGVSQGIGATALFVHPTYQAEINKNPTAFNDIMISSDLAVIKLDRPAIDTGDYFGLATSCEVRANGQNVVQDFRGVALAGYPRDTEIGALIKSTCDVPAGFDPRCADKRFNFQCSILGGNSGGPVFAEYRYEDGRTIQYIFAVVSAEAGDPSCLSASNRAGATFADPTRCVSSATELDEEYINLIQQWVGA